MSNEPNSSVQAREIKNLGILDLTALKSPEELATISAIKNVGVVLVPQSLAAKLVSIPMKNVAVTQSVADGVQVKPRVLMGAVKMTGEALANPTGEDGNILVVMGSLVITTPVQKVGYDHMVVMGSLLAPKGSETALGAGITNLQGSAFYYTSGGEVKTQSGQVKLSGKALANATGKPDDILIIEGQGVITSPVEKVGYQQIIVAGQLMAPRESQTELEGYLQVAGQVLWYSGTPRMINNDERFAAEFFEFLKEPVTLIINSHVVIEADVTVDLFKAKVEEIVLNGDLEGPSHLISLLQALTSENNGRIFVTGETPTDDES